jgi:hypothetical protein
MPLEQMAQVGMYKQQKYDEGVQKIQSYIDNVAGLDVIRDADKQYLQSKLDELGGKLKTVAAGDFSNFQLVNSVGGMANQISRDKTVQTAVSSTAKYRKSLTEMETARKEGKSSPSNEFIFNRSVNEWLSNNEAGKDFSGIYKPYTNWKKNSLEVLKALTKDETITEDAFTVNSKGQMVIADAIVRKKMAGLSPEKIQQALMVGLTPADFEQMQMDGIYSYANSTPDDLREKINSSYTDKKDFYESQLSSLNLAKLSTKSEVEKTGLEDKIQSLKKTLKNVDDDYKNLMQSVIEGKDDAVKAQLYTSNALNGFSKAFSFTEIENSYKSSPFVEVAMDREKMAIDWKKFSMNYAQSERQFNANYNLEIEKLGQLKKANELKEQEIRGLGGLPSPIPQEELPKYKLGTIMNEIGIAEKTLGAADDEFAKANKFGSEKLEELRMQYLQRPGSVSPVVASYFNSTEQLRRDVAAKKTMILDLETKAKAQHGDINQLIPANAPSINYRIGNAVTTFTPKDFVDFNSKVNEYINVTAPSGPGGDASIKFNDEKARRELNSKEYKLYEIEKKRIAGESRGGKMNDAEKIISENIINYNKTVNVPYQKTLKKINEDVQKGLDARIMQPQGVSYNVPAYTVPQKQQLGAMFMQVVDLAEKQKGGIANSPGFNTKTLKEIATSSDINASIRVVEGTSREPAMYEITAIGSEGTTTKFRMTPEQKLSVFGQDRFEASPNIRAIRPYQEQMTLMGGLSTAYDNSLSATVKNSYLSAIDFPSVQTYGIKANIVKLPDNLYSIIGTVYNPVTKRWHDNIDLSGGITEENVNLGLRNLNDAAIYTILNEKVPTARDLQMVNNASKQPF